MPRVEVCSMPTEAREAAPGRKLTTRDLVYLESCGECASRRHREKSHGSAAAPAPGSEGETFPACTQTRMICLRLVPRHAVSVHDTDSRLCTQSLYSVLGTCHQVHSRLCTRYMPRLVPRHGTPKVQPGRDHAPREVQVQPVYLPRWC